MTNAQNNTSFGEYGHLLFHGDDISVEDLLLLGRDYISYIRLEDAGDDVIMIHIYAADGMHIFETDDATEALGWMSDNGRIPVALH